MARTFCVLALVLTACAAGQGRPASEAGAEGETAALRPGWTLVTLPDEGFSIAVPHGWVSLAPPDLETAGALEALEQEHPDQGPLMDAAARSMDAGAMSLLAFDPSSPREVAGFTRNFSVGRVSDTTTAPAEIAEELATDVEDAEIANGPVERGTEIFPVGEVAVIRYEWTVTLFESTADLAITQYGIPDANERFVLTFTSLAGESQYQDIWAATMESFDVER